MEKKGLFIKSDGALIPKYKINANILDVADLLRDPIQDGESICINSEACLEVVHAQLEEGATKEAIELLKNKFAFREATARLFPELKYYKTSLKDLESVQVKSVIKPVKGFFSAGVRIIEPNDDLKIIKSALLADIKRLSEYFSETVLSSEEWLVEDCIEGQELAVDMYYNTEGDPIILNITLHPMPSDPHYLNAIYWTSEELFNLWKGPVEQFFKFLNTDILNVVNFPIHAEFRINQEKLIPIEMNPMRFGGFGLADLAYYGLGFNPYDMFFNNTSPDWEAIWEQRMGQRFCWALGYNGKEIDPEQSVPDHTAFITFCGQEHLLHYRPIDWKSLPVFALAYLSLDTQEEIDAFLTVDFNQFFHASVPAYL